MQSLRIGRNELCPCRSGRKFKHCCSKGSSDPLAISTTPKETYDTFSRGGQAGKGHSPDDRLYVWIEYTIHDALGTAEVSYRYPHGQLILLTNGKAVPVENLTTGMVFVLEDTGTATVTRVGKPVRWEPNLEHRDDHGNSLRRVVGTFKFTGWVPLMTVTVGGESHQVTPAHMYWSESRRDWYPIGTFHVGEKLRAFDDRQISIEALTPPKWVQTTVHNFEVDEYHTFFVGRGTSAVWVHNGLDGAGCRVPRAAVVDALKRGVINLTTKIRAGVIRPDRHHVFPQAFRDWFRRRGVDIDRYTLPLDKGTHSALHYGGGKGKGGGYWNKEIMRRLMEREALLGRELTAREILLIGAKMRNQYANGVKVIHYTAP